MTHPLPPAPIADALLQACPTALAHVDPEGRLGWWNDAWAERVPATSAGLPLAAALALDAAGAAALAQAAAEGASFPLKLAGQAFAVQLRTLADGSHSVALQAAPPPAEAEVRRLTESMQLVRSLGRLAFWERDLVEGSGRWDPEAFTFRGREPADAPPSLADSMLHVIEPDRANLSSAVAGSLARPSTDTHAHRYRVMGNDGRLRHLHSAWQVLSSAEGRPQRIVGVTMDDTETLEQGRSFDTVVAQLAMATELSGVTIWRHDFTTGRIHFNAEGFEALRLPPRSGGLPKEEMAALVHPDDVASARESSRLARRSGRAVDHEVRLRRGDGQWRHFMTRRVLQRDAAGQPCGFIGVALDITERRRVETELRQASERAALAARGVGLGTWEQDLRTGEAFWDSQMWRLRGRSPQSQAPDEAGRFALVHPDDRAWVRQQNDLAQRDDAPWNYEFRVMLPDGRERWLASRSITLRDEHGRPVRRIGVNWDVTDARTADAARREREIAQRENQAKSKFLARMSHELRTPLNGVLGFAQLLLDEDAATDPAAAVRRRRVEQIRSAGQHLLTLINDVLDLASLEGGEMRIVMQPVPLAPLVADTLPLVEPMLRDSGLTLDCGALDVTPLADATRLRQVLLNLLSNAIKYNRPGGRVQLEAACHGSGVVIRVADSGRGMSDEQMLHLFEPFNRLGMEGEGIEGTGIGLAIVKALTERMGGSVHVDSQVGQGSLFELRLADASLRPLAAPPTPSASRPVPLTSSGEPVRGTLLYIEDNPINALIIVELIARRRDLVLHVADDGASGVAKAIELRPDLVLLDMQLPDIDGHEVLRRLRAHPATERTPVIALSANAMPEDIERALRAGMAGYWTKPLDFAAFMASIEALFGPPPAAAASGA